MGSFFCFFLRYFPAPPLLLTVSSLFSVRKTVIYSTDKVVQPQWRGILRGDIPHHENHGVCWHALNKKTQHIVYTK